MNIIFGDLNIEELRKKYIVLELDTFKTDPNSEAVTAYCVIEHMPILEMSKTQEFQNLHQNLMKNYRLRNWNYCEQAIEHLMTCWNGELKSFYHELNQRVSNYKQHDPGPDWDGCYLKSMTTA